MQLKTGMAVILFGQCLVEGVATCRIDCPESGSFH